MKVYQTLIFCVVAIGVVALIFGAQVLYYQSVTPQRFVESERTEGMPRFADWRGLQNSMSIGPDIGQAKSDNPVLSAAGLPSAADLEPFGLGLADSEVEVNAQYAQVISDENSGSLPDSLGPILPNINNDASEPSNLESPYSQQTKPPVAEPVAAVPMPEKLTTPNNASPIDDNSAAALRAIIDEGLPVADVEEKDFWFEELQGMPLEAARDILMMRRNLGLQPAEPIVTPLPKELKTTYVPQREELPFNDAILPPPTYSPAPLDMQLGQRLDATIDAIKHAQQVVLNNIANSQTPGFRSLQIQLTDAAYDRKRHGQSGGVADAIGRSGIPVGWGVQVAGAVLDQRSGPLRRTDRRLDLAIIGDGFFQVQSGAEIQYTRVGGLTTNQQGDLCLIAGAVERMLSPQTLLIEPTINIPATAEALFVTANGMISYTQSGSGTVTAAGQLQLTRFPNAEGLAPLGNCLYSETNASGNPVVGMPGKDGRGTIRSGYLEGSNVNLEQELAALRALTQQLRAIQQAGTILNGEMVETRTGALPPLVVEPLPQIDPGNVPLLTDPVITPSY